MNSFDHLTGSKTVSTYLMKLNWSSWGFCTGYVAPDSCPIKQEACFRDQCPQRFKGSGA